MTDRRNAPRRDRLAVKVTGNPDGAHVLPVAPYPLRPNFKPFAPRTRRALMTRPAAVRMLALKIPQDRALALGFTFAFAMILTPS